MSSQNQIVAVPKGCLFYGNWYVYYNIESIYDPSIKYTKTKRMCIGRNIDRKTMYANIKNAVINIAPIEKKP